MSQATLNLAKLNNQFEALSREIQEEASRLQALSNEVPVQERSAYNRFVQERVKEIFDKLRCMSMTARSSTPLQKYAESALSQLRSSSQRYLLSSVEHQARQKDVFFILEQLENEPSPSIPVTQTKDTAFSPDELSQVGNPITLRRPPPRLEKAIDLTQTFLGAYKHHDPEGIRNALIDTAATTVAGCIPGVNVVLGATTVMDTIFPNGEASLKENVRSACVFDPDLSNEWCQSAVQTQAVYTTLQSAKEAVQKATDALATKTKRATEELGLTQQNVLKGIRDLKNSLKGSTKE